jgi:hypothetical protein
VNALHIDTFSGIHDDTMMQEQACVSDGSVLEEKLKEDLAILLSGLRSQVLEAAIFWCRENGIEQIGDIRQTPQPFFKEALAPAEQMFPLLCFVLGVSRILNWTLGSIPYLRFYVSPYPAEANNSKRSTTYYLLQVLCCVLVTPFWIR